MRLIALVLLVASALNVVGCTSTQQASASKEKLNLSARSIVGTSLIGAKGETSEDENKIEDTVAGLCGAGVWTKSECDLHDKKVK